MTPKEFSDSFDTLLNSYNTQNSFGDTQNYREIVLDEYEKSLFLTQAQEQIVVELYTGRNNKGESFESTEELRSNLKSLIRTKVLKESIIGQKGISPLSKFFDAPPDLLFITYESAIIDNPSDCNNNSELEIIPVSQDEFHNIKNNPFKGPSHRRALRLDNSDSIIEIVSKYDIRNYTIRYLSKPTPIILANLEGVSIDDKNTIKECTLDSVLHRTILERAVQLALISRSNQNRSNV